MAIHGNLRDFSLTQLLNLVHLARKSGMLVLQRPGETAQVYFRDGRLASAFVGEPMPRLADLLLDHRRLTGRQYAVICQNLNGDSDAAVGMRLVTAGMLNQADIIACLERYHLNNIRQLFAWPDGEFHFDAGASPPDGRIAVRVSLENLILEGAHQAHEQQHLQAEIPSLNMALQFRQRPKDGLQGLKLSPTEWQVIQYVNPRNTLRQIGELLKLDEVDLRRAVYALMQAGVVDLVRPAGPEAAPVSPAPALVSKTRTEQKSLLARIIQKIRSI